MNLNIRYNNGYRQFQDPQTGSWIYTHRRVAEKKLGRSILSTEEVHHINKDKQDNRSNNLSVIDRRIHQEVIHQSKYHETHACFRCGYTNHWVSQCFAKVDVLGRVIR